MKVRDVMTAAVRVCAPEDSLNQAAQAMWDGDLGWLPVVDGDAKVVGVITDRDLAMAAHLRGAPLWALQVADAMATVVFTAKPSDSVRNASKLMSKHQLRRMPIVDGEQRLCGVLTLGALACCAVAKGKRPLGPKDVAAILAAVSAPRPLAPTETMVVELVRESAPADDVLQPAPRKSSKAAPKAASKASPKVAAKAKSKSKSAK